MLRGCVGYWDRIISVLYVSHLTLPHLYCIMLHGVSTLKSYQIPRISCCIGWKWVFTRQRLDWSSRLFYFDRFFHRKLCFCWWLQQDKSQRMFVVSSNLFNIYLTYVQTFRTFSVVVNSNIEKVIFGMQRLSICPPAELKKIKISPRWFCSTFEFKYAFLFLCDET